MQKFEKEFNEALKAETNMSPRERMALFDLFCLLRDAAQMKRDEDVLREYGLMVAGAIQFLKSAGKIQDDEDIHMLLNAVEGGKI